MIGLITKDELSPTLQETIENSGGKLSTFPNTVSLTEESSVVNIGIAEYDKQTDTLLVFLNSTFLMETRHYTVTDNTKITSAEGTWKLPSNFDFIVLKNVKVPTEVFSGTLLSDGSVDKVKLTQSLQDAIDSIQVIQDNNILTSTHNNKQDRELAYMKLKQTDSERLENGVLFADDMNNGGYGITFDAANSDNVVIRDNSMLMISYGEAEKTVTDAIVTDDSYYCYSPQYTKFIRLDNGTFIFTSIKTNIVELFKSADGVNWTSINQKTPTGSTSGHTCLVKLPNNKIGQMIGYKESLNNEKVEFRILNDSGTVEKTYVIETIKQVMDVHVVYDETTSTIHGAWECLTTTYSATNNIRYSKGVYNAETNEITWDTNVQQLTTAAATPERYKAPYIIMSSTNKPVIYCYHATVSTTYDLAQLVYNGTSWVLTTGIASGLPSSYNPLAIYIPKEISGLANNETYVFFHKTTATYNQRGITFIKSTTDGASFSEYPIVEENASIANFSVSANGNKVFLLYETLTGSSQRDLKLKVCTNGIWEESQTIKPYVDIEFEEVMALQDFDTDMVDPIYILHANNFLFNGKWMGISEVPTTTATAAYNLDATNYVNAFVKKAGAVSITAKLNNVDMDSVLENDEYQFTKKLPTTTNVQLKFSLSRENITGGNNDKVTRILGSRG